MCVSQFYVFYEILCIVNNSRIFGGFRALQKIGSKFFCVNARSIESVGNIRYQITFCHLGMNIRDQYSRERKFLYPREMEEWMDNILTLEKLNEELQEFRLTYKD